MTLPDLKNNVLAVSVDENYVDAAKQLFASVYFNAGWQGDYLLLATNISAAKLEWFRKKGIYVYQCQPLMKKGREFYPVSNVSLLYLFQEYFKKWEKILFLDADMIVRGSLDDLVKHQGFAAAPFLVFKKLKLKTTLWPEFQKANNLPKRYNLNDSVAGVSVNVIDTGVINPETFGELKKILERYGKIAQAADELVLSLYFYRRWQKISQFYNIVPRILVKYCGLKPDKIRGVILHFLGSNDKPWFERSDFYQEWLGNFKKADLIDLANRPPAKQKWQRHEIYGYVFYIYLRYILRRPLFITIWILGITGKMILAVSPQLYFKLKQFFK